MVTHVTPLEQIPLFIRAGTVLPLAPEMDFTGQMPWNPVTLDLYPQSEETNSATIYEDDGQTTAYQTGQFRKTLVTVSLNKERGSVLVEIGAAKGDFKGALLQRRWILRLHAPSGWPNLASNVSLNGKKEAADFHYFPRTETAMPFGDRTGSPDGGIFELELPAAPVSRTQRIEIFRSDVAHSVSALARPGGYTAR
jgi:hypothetical protein